jgi:hypothetical protein
VGFYFPSFATTDCPPQANISVSSVPSISCTGYNGATDENGQASFTLPQGSYRFRADLNGTQFWSDSEDSCELPGCSGAAVTVTKPLTVTVQSQIGTPYAGLKVYAFDRSRYTGYNDTSDADGLVSFTLPQGSYHFRADYDGVQFWSGQENHCSLPGCESAAVLLPGAKGEETLTIDYTYDPLREAPCGLSPDCR